MNLLDALRRDLAYNAWANRETLQSLLEARAVPQRAGAVMAHIVAAEWLWLARLGLESPLSGVWPAFNLDECATHLQKLGQVWQGYLDDLHLPGLDREIQYTNSKGEAWTSAVSDVLTHIVSHGAYHRGQIATLLGSAGEKAAYSDYIEWARRKYDNCGWPT